MTKRRNDFWLLASTSVLGQAEVRAANGGNGETAVSTSAELQELYRQEQVSFEFLTRHKDFNNCEANINLIKDYFQEYRLDWTLENLERVFSELKPQLAPVQGTPKNASAPEPPPPPVPAAPAVEQVVEPLGLTLEEINKWDGPTMRKKMADPVTRKQIDRCLAAEAELRRLELRQKQRLGEE